jgi:hypothetical protein
MFPRNKVSERDFEIMKGRPMKSSKVHPPQQQPFRIWSHMHGAESGNNVSPALKTVRSFFLGRLLLLHTE